MSSAIAVIARRADLSCRAAEIKRLAEQEARKTQGQKR